MTRTGLLDIESLSRPDIEAILARSKEFQPHLDAPQSTGEHQIVETSQMTDAERLAGEPAQPRSQRHIEPLQHKRAELSFIEAVWQQNGRNGRAVFARVQSTDLETPGADRAASCFGVTLVAAEHVLQAFFGDHRQ